MTRYVVAGLWGVDAMHEWVFVAMLLAVMIPLAIGTWMITVQVNPEKTVFGCMSLRLNARVLMLAALTLRLVTPWIAGPLYAIAAQLTASTFSGATLYLILNLLHPLTLVLTGIAFALVLWHAATLVDLLPNIAARAVAVRRSGTLFLCSSLLATLVSVASVFGWFSVLGNFLEPVVRSTLSGITAIFWIVAVLWSAASSIRILMSLRSLTGRGHAPRGPDPSDLEESSVW